jgi:hypothetical protein
MQTSYGPISFEMIKSDREILSYRLKGDRLPLPEIGDQKYSLLSSAAAGEFNRNDGNNRVNHVLLSVMMCPKQKMPLVTAMKCPACQTDNPSDSKFSRSVRRRPGPRVCPGVLFRRTRT